MNKRTEQAKQRKGASESVRVARKFEFQLRGKFSGYRADDRCVSGSQPYRSFVFGLRPYAQHPFEIESEPSERTTTRGLRARERIDKAKLMNKNVLSLTKEKATRTA